MALLYDNKKRRQVKKEAKIEAGKKGKKGKKIDEKYQKEGSKGKKNYQGTNIGRFLRKNLTKSKYGLKPVGRGGGQPVEDRKKRPLIKPPTQENVSEKRSVFKSSQVQETPNKVVGNKVIPGKIKDIGIQEDKSKASTVKGRSTQDVIKKGDEAAKKTKFTERTSEQRSRDEKFFESTPEIKHNKKKVSEYMKRKAERKEQEKKEKYVKGSRTQKQKAKDASLDLARNRATSTHGEGKGTRTLYRNLKKKKIAEMKKKRKKSPLARF